MDEAVEQLVNHDDALVGRGVVAALLQVGDEVDEFLHDLLADIIE